ncbi:sigma-70 family RNA polymerase sigma factor [bacterium]|nr:MAG: sigma-70 family RNA polymerase sigma factor [bacterium]
MELVLPLTPAVADTSPQISDDETLWLARARRGDIAALDALMNVHRGRILNLAFQILRNESEAEDAAQEAFVRAFNKLSSFREKSGFGTWLYRVALNVCLERKRAQRETEALCPELPAPSTTFDERLALEWALDHLSEPLRLVLILREWHGLSYDEMASALNIPVGTVRSRLSAARDEFRRLWTQMEAE